MKNYRKIGHDYERLIAKEMREKLGYTEAQTSRYASRLLDDCKVDIANVPLNIQCKRYLRRNVNYAQVFKEMTELLKAKFPSMLQFPRLIFHKRGPSDLEEFVVMPKVDFYNLLNQQLLLTNIKQQNDNSN